MSQDARGAPSYLQALLARVVTGWESGESFCRGGGGGADQEERRCPGKAHFSLWKKPSDAGGLGGGGGSPPFNWTLGYR